MQKTPPPVRESSSKMNHRVHRISHHAEVSYPLLDRGILSIGWSDFSTEEFIEKARNDWDYFEQSFQDEGWGSPKNRHSLWRFIAEMEKGDLVVVPSLGKFSVYEIVEDSPFSVQKLDTTGLEDWNGNKIIVSEGYLRRETDKSGEAIDLGFFRKVIPAEKDIPRSEYADQALTSRMKTRWTNIEISDIAESVRNAIEAFRCKKPINLHAQIINKVSAQILELIQTQLEDTKFEALVRWYFEKLGATSVRLAKNEPGKKGDADIEATFEPLRTIIYVQAKKHTGVTSEWALEQIREYQSSKDAIDDGYVRIGWVISSGEKFSEECIAAAKEAHVVLIDGPQFATMLLNVGISTLENAL